MNFMLDEVASFSEEQMKDLMGQINFLGRNI